MYQGASLFYILDSNYLDSLSVSSALSSESSFGAFSSAF